MAINTTPIFVVAPRTTSNLVSTANTNRDGTGTLVTLVTGAAGRTKVFSCTIQAIGVTTANMVRLFIYDGTSTGLIWEQSIAAVTPSDSIQAERYDIYFDGVNMPEVFLQSGALLRASTDNAESYMLTCFCGDYE
jgi:hypothetical protein